MENVKTCSEDGTFSSSRRSESRERNVSKEKVGAGYLHELAIVVHVVTGGSIALAVAFTSEIVLFTTFWHGFFLGGVMYGLMILVLGTDEEVCDGTDEEICDVQ